MAKHTRQAPCDCYVNDETLMACPLHAAAPALLEALEDVLRVHFENAKMGELPTIRKARAAIAQAKGESNG